MFVYRWVAISILSLIFTTVQASVRVDENMHYYDIYGNSTDELNHQMQKHSPMAVDGVRYYAATRWFVRWDYDYSRTISGCALKNVAISVQVEENLPRWVNREDAPYSLISEWDRFYDALTQHEQGHGVFGKNSGLAIDNALNHMGTAATCQDLEKRVKASTESILNAYLSEERQYDIDTNHGIATGAFLN